jgi:tetratricopeptide (TPR) repeat protein
MYNVLISLAAGVLVFVALSFALGGGEFEWLYGLVPGVVTQLGVYFVLARRSMNAVQEVSARAQAKLAAAQQSGANRSQKQLERAVNDAIAVLKEGYEHGKWQFFVDAQIDGQIGQLLYMVKQYDKAQSYLERSFNRNWVARAMLGALLYKKKKYDEMKEVFEEAVEKNKKESLLWNLYAYCMWKQGKKDEALEVLNRAIEHVGTDDKTKANLKALQNDKKMKMRGWNMMWYQFHLDAPPVQRQRTQFRRR